MAITGTIPLFKVFMAEEVKDSVIKTLYSGYITQGSRVTTFEKRLGDFLHNPNVLTLNSATSGLQLAVHLAGGGLDKYIISTPMTCSATNTAIVANGTNIIWADINPETGNIDPNSVEHILKHNTKQFISQTRSIRAIMAVDWGGYPCDWVDLQYLAEKYGVKLIRDAAHAFGATFQGEIVGDWCDYTVYSFQAIKHLTTVDGGALICKSIEDHNRAKLLRWYGIDRESLINDMRCEEDIQEAGFKYHMNDVNASIGIENLEYMYHVLNMHKDNGRFYDEIFKKSILIKPTKKMSNRTSAYWIYTILIDHRDEFIKQMLLQGIMTSQVHSRVDEHSAFRKFARVLPNTDIFTKRQVNIPVGWWVTKEERNYIAETAERVVGNLT